VHDCFPSRELLASQYRTKLFSNHSPAPSRIRYNGRNAVNTQGLLINREPGADGVIMTRLQISLQREIAGWPLYTIILALGQV
jgi:alpha-1,3-glucan synthase